ncbi:MAG TPA: ribonuclease P protein component [Chloroflexota bacterium]|nr:ribonuclease P protein component [Chloroflexota bacterium]
MKRLHRLRTAADFAAVREQAERAWPHGLLVLYVAPNDLGYPRVGITVSGRVGKAVVRNKVRRRLRELLQARLPQIKPRDVLVIARPSSAEASWHDLGETLDQLLERSGATDGQSVGV